MNINNLLQEIAKEASKKLAIWLPEIGKKNWWRNYVYDQLSISQQQILQADSGSLHELDSAAIYRVLARNWSELCIHRNITSLKKTGLKYVREAQDIRNQLAHLPVSSEIDNRDLIRFSDTLARLAEELQLNSELINQANYLWRESISGRHVRDEPHEELSTQEKLTENIGADLPNQNLDENIEVLLINKSAKSDLHKMLSEKTFIGIDFGTSTTVVTAVVLNGDGVTELKTLDIKQPTQYGDELEHYLVNSILTVHKNKLLFGSDAYSLKNKCIEGVTTFSSFKMMLGIDHGIRYPNSQAKSTRTGNLIRTAQDAALEFFSFLRLGIERAVKELNLPPSINYVVSVPASFEANQRRDLVDSLRKSGFDIDEASLIDEPNAAFLSYLHDSLQIGNEFAKFLHQGNKNILVYDFGAGTCDVSILSISLNSKQVVSKNLAISRFMALGGDDIDRFIAKNILFKKVRYSKSDFHPTQDEIIGKIIPWLKPIAESLKKYCTNQLNFLEIDTFQSAKEIDYFAEADMPEPLNLEDGVKAHIDSPSLSMVDYANALINFSSAEDFNELLDQDEGVGEPKNINAPITNAVNKAGLDFDEIDMLLFIGGSAKSSLIRSIVKDNFSSKTQVVVPRDLQAHVSRGAALHSLGHHGFSYDFIKPITSEPIYLITRGASLKLIFPPGTSVPTDQPFLEKFRIQNEAQKTIELPLCVSNENKLLGILKINSPNSKGFKKDDEVELSCSITHDKLLAAKAIIDGKEYQAALMNPLSNRELTIGEVKILEARQTFNEILIQNQGRPTSSSLLAFATALIDGECYLEAADYLIQLEQLNGSNHATNICYCYSLGGKNKESMRWAEIAFNRDKNDVNCYNLSLFIKDNLDKKMSLLRESLSFNPEYVPALVALGEILLSKGISEGPDLLEVAAKEIESQIVEHTASQKDCALLIKVANDLGRSDLKQVAEARYEHLNSGVKVFNEDNLVISNEANLIRSS